ncbi:MAG: ABC transporter ATP-binding protein [Lachnospiraceae bacterium]
MIEFKDVSFYYGEEAAQGVRHISLTAKRGEVILLCGESGCGKTTITRLVNGLIPHYYEGTLTGSVTVQGREIQETPLYDMAPLVGSVFQNPRSQFFNVDTTSELAFGCENLGMPEEEILQRMEQTVREFGMQNLMGRNIFKLSGGEKQKIACASVGTLQPDIIVLDEPSSNLDIVAIEELRKMLSLWKAQQKTILISEHRLYYLRELIDRVYYMADGEICGEYTAAQFLQLSVAELAAKGLRPLTLESLAADTLPVAAEQDKPCEVLTLHNFKFSYSKEAETLDVPQLCLPQGEVIALVGYNGAGKSTFARCLCGLEKKCRATLAFDGKTHKQKEFLRQGYMVMQDVNHQLFTESVLEEVLLSMQEPQEEKACQILEKLDLLSMKELHPMSLSGGEKQRVAIASAIASQRPLILFDEPTSGLDHRHMQEVASTIKSLTKEGKTVLVVTHDPEFILSCCSYVIHLAAGKVVREYALDVQGIEEVIDFFRNVS